MASQGNGRNGRNGRNRRVGGVEGGDGGVGGGDGGVGGDDGDGDGDGQDKQDKQDKQERQERQGRRQDKQDSKDGKKRQDGQYKQDGIDRQDGISRQHGKDRIDESRRLLVSGYRTYLSEFDDGTLTGGGGDGNDEGERDGDGDGEMDGQIDGERDERDEMDEMDGDNYNGENRILDQDIMMYIQDRRVSLVGQKIGLENESTRGLAGSVGGLVGGAGITKYEGGGITRYEGGGITRYEGGGITRYEGAGIEYGGGVGVVGVSGRRTGDGIKSVDERISERYDGKFGDNYGAVGGAGAGLLRKPSHCSSIGDIMSRASEMVPEAETTFTLEIGQMLRSSLPLIGTFLLQYSLTVASVFSVGRLGANELAAVSLASMTANISGYAIICGVSTCLDTLCAQAYGARKFDLVGVHYIKCTYLLFLVYIPIFYIWFFMSETILVSLVGQESAPMCRLAAQYLRLLVIGLPGYIVFENTKHFLQSQGIFHASTYVLTICAPLNAVLNYVLVWSARFGLGYVGAPLSVVITNWLMCVMLLFYVMVINGHQCLPDKSLFSTYYFKDWSKMIRLSVPGLLMIEAEWLAFEIITFEASRFGTEVLAAQSVVSTICVLLYQIPFAVSVATATRIAWYVGAASPKAAMTSTRATISLSLAGGIFNAGFILMFRHSLASLFSDDKLVRSLAAEVLVIGAFYQISDFLSCSTAGVLRGQGRQSIGGILNLVGYYLIAMPFSYALAFHFQLELIGLWMGMILALAFISLAQLYFVMSSNWQQIIDNYIMDSLQDSDNHTDVASLAPSISGTHIA